jgi:hypothetical protein
MKSAARRAQHSQHFAYLDEEPRPAKPDDALYPRALKHRTDSVQPNQKWSPRQTLLFIVGASVLLWTAIFWVSIHYL